jgi:hypothetical protein
MVALSGIEPELSALRGRRVNQLHHSAMERRAAVIPHPEDPTGNGNAAKNLAENPLDDKRFSLGHRSLPLYDELILRSESLGVFFHHD